MQSNNVRLPALGPLSLSHSHSLFSNMLTSFHFRVRRQRGDKPFDSTRTGSSSQPNPNSWLDFWPTHRPFAVSVKIHLLRKQLAWNSIFFWGGSWDGPDKNQTKFCMPALIRHWSWENLYGNFIDSSSPLSFLRFDSLVMQRSRRTLLSFPTIQDAEDEKWTREWQRWRSLMGKGKRRSWATGKKKSKIEWRGHWGTKTKRRKTRRRGRLVRIIYFVLLHTVHPWLQAMYELCVRVCVCARMLV